MYRYDNLSGDHGKHPMKLGVSNSACFGLVSQVEKPTVLLLPAAAVVPVLWLSVPRVKIYTTFFIFLFVLHCHLDTVFCYPSAVVVFALPMPTYCM